MHRLLLLLLLLLASFLAEDLLGQTGNEVVTISTSNRHREMNPQITADGQTLYFTRGKHPRNQGSANSGDIWFRQLQTDGSWGRALNAGGPINSFAHDELIGISTDNRRLAVLRKGVGNAYVDIVERGQRTWRVSHSIELPEALGAHFSATFDLETSRLIYCREEAQQHDLFSRYLKDDNHWTDEVALSLINTTADEREPYLSPDGSTLYFRKSGEWHRAAYDIGRAAYVGPVTVANALPSRYLEISMNVVSPTTLYVSTDEAGRDERLIRVNFPASARPPASRLLSGRVAVREARNTGAGSLRVMIDIDEKRRMVYPDQDGKYTIVVPAAGYERFAAEAPGYFTSMSTAYAIEESIMSANTSGKETAATTYSNEYYNREQSINELHQKISATSQEMQELEARRSALKQRIRNAQLTAGEEVLAGYIDPELSKLRSQMATAGTNLRDTVPPASTLTRKGVPPSTDKPTIRNEANAAAIDELEALRARFRASQEATLGNTDKDYNWKSADPLLIRQTAAKQIQEELIPTISQDIVKQAYNRQQIDSMKMEQNIRSNLFTPDSKPAVYERQAWENQLIDNIDPAAKQALREKLQPALEQSVAEDAEIQRSLEDRGRALQDYQQQLQQNLDAQLNEEQKAAITSRAYSSPTTYGSSQTTAKGIASPAHAGSKDTPASNLNTVIPTRPATNLELVRLAPGNVITLSQLRFAPNSATFKPGTEAELDRFAVALLQHPELKVEIGVHSNSRLNHTFAKELSQRRAKQIVDYLISRDVPEVRLNAIGYGRDKPIADTNTVEGRLKNERVEARIQ